MRRSTSSIALAAALAAYPALAQQSANDFQLPPAPTPSASPRVEGPVDDSGIVPVAPRPVNTPTPSPAETRPAPAPTPTPTPTATNTAPSRAIAQPNPQSTSSQREPASPVQNRTPQTLPTRTQAPNALDPSPQNADMGQADDGLQTGAGSAPIADPAASEPLIASAPTQADNAEPFRLPKNWLWWAGGLAASLLALWLGWMWWRRREKPVPQLSQSPAEGAGSEEAPAKPDLQLKLEIEQLSRSMMMMTLKCRITLSNRCARAARDVTVSADLVSANRALPMDAQIASATAFLPELGSSDRIGPHKTHSFAGTLTLPVQQLAAFKHGERPMCVPLARVRMDCGDCEPLFRTFVVGIAADPSLQSSSKLHPVPLDGTLGSYPDVRARAVTNSAAG